MLMLHYDTVSGVVKLFDVGTRTQQRNRPKRESNLGSTGAEAFREKGGDGHTEIRSININTEQMAQP